MVDGVVMVMVVEVMEVVDLEDGVDVVNLQSDLYYHMFLIYGINISNYCNPSFFTLLDVGKPFIKQLT